MLYRTHNQKGLVNCLIDQTNSIIIGYDDMDSMDTKFMDIIGINQLELTHGKTIFRIPGSGNEKTASTLFEIVKAIVSKGGLQAAKEIGQWKHDQYDQYMQRLLDLHFIYCMPSEAHLMNMMMKNPVLLKMMERFELQIRPAARTGA